MHDEARQSATKGKHLPFAGKKESGGDRLRFPPLYFCAVGKFHLYLVASMRTAKTHSAAVSME